VEASFLVADFTSIQPSWRNSEGNEGNIWPSFCLPWFRGEPPLVGEAARLHRRASQVESYDPEAQLDLSNRGRWHWAEGWLGMTQSPDSIHPANVRMSWTPPGEKKDVSISFPAALREALAQIGSKAKSLGLVVPSALGPGPRQELLDELQKDFRGEILFIPRPIAAALSWCRSNAGQELLQATGATAKTRVGSLLVTTAGTDTWEAAEVPLRLEENDGDRTLCPVQDRTRFPSETGIIGLAWIAGENGNQQPAHISHSWLLQEPSTYLGKTTLKEYLNASNHLKIQLQESGVAPDWAPTSFPDDILSQARALKNSGQLLNLVHCGIQQGQSLPGGLASVEREASHLHQLLPGCALLNGASEAMRRLERAFPPFYEALAPLDLHVLGRNKFHDPVSVWKPLLEKTEVPAGEEYISRKPIDDISLPAGSSSIDLFIRTKRRGAVTYYQAMAEQKETLKNQEPVLIRARVRPGQGSARVEIHSVTPQLFDVSLQERRLQVSSSPPPLEYAWPPGSAFVASYRELERNARPQLNKVIEESRRGVANQWAIRLVTEEINAWIPSSSQPYAHRSLVVPEDIDELFIYLGTIPSSGAPSDSTMRLLVSSYGKAIEQYVKHPGTDRNDHTGLWAASWLYENCPSSILKATRKGVQGNLPVLPALLACAGNCFTKADDFKIFFRELSWCVREKEFSPLHWLRAYRNLARFRHDALSLAAISHQDQADILNWVLDTFELSIRDRKRDYRRGCCTLFPHLLKRRRFDPNFLAKGTRQFRRADEVLKSALEVNDAPKPHISAKCALAFLHQSATRQTLEQLSLADQEGNHT
jgi:hypothetical protein